MAKTKYDSQYQETIEFIYETIANKIENRRLYLNKSKTNIIGKKNYDLSLLSKIFNNRRGVNNRYLIPGAYNDLLVEELEYENTMDMLWINNGETCTNNTANTAEYKMKYIREILSKLMLEAFNKNPAFNEELESVLREDVEYGDLSRDIEFDWYKTSSDIKNGEIPAKLEDKKPILVSFFSEMYGLDYIFLDHLNKNNGLSNLDKCIDNFVENRLTPLLNFIANKSIFDTQINNIISENNELIEKVENFEIDILPMPDKEYMSAPYLDKQDIQSQIANNASAYIKELKEIQDSIYKTFYMESPDKKNTIQKYINIVENEDKSKHDKESFIECIEKCRNMNEELILKADDYDDYKAFK